MSELIDKLTDEPIVAGRPGITFKSLGLKVNRIDTYRTKNVWWRRLWKPKYNTHLLAMTDKAIYDICNPQTDECGNLFHAPKSNVGDTNGH